MNLAILVGTVVSDIQRLDFSGATLTKFRLKTVEKLYLDGETKERSQTHLIDVWNSFLQDKVTPNLRQGQFVEVQGAIESRNIAKEGEPARWTTSIVLRQTGLINIHGGPNSGVSTQEEARAATPKIDHRRAAPAPALNDSDGLESDVPF